MQETSFQKTALPPKNTRQNNRQKSILRAAQNATFYRVCLYILRGGKNSPKITLNRPISAETARSD
jgi:hypothetical protein